MATSVLRSGEKALNESPVSNVTMDGQIIATKGTLIATEDRILLVTQQGTFNKKYDVQHSYRMANISNIRTEKRMFGGNALVVEIVIDGEMRIIRYEGIANPQDWIFLAEDMMAVGDVVDSWKSRVTILVNSKERTKFSEIRKILEEDGSEGNVDIAKMLGNLIAEGEIEGFVDEENGEFVHMTAYKQRTEVVNYNIAASFNFNSNGAIEIKCPNCGASQEMKERKSQVLCKYCSKTYVVPEKILKLL